MKAWWKIHDKPRGRWRPLMEWGVSFSPTEEKECRELNIARGLHFVFGKQDADKINRCRQCNTTLKGGVRISAIGIFPEPVFGVGFNEPDQGYIIGCTCGERWLWYGRVDFPRYVWQCRLPWRPGTRPDYSDYIEAVRDFLRQVMEEIERRLQEARESAPSDEWMLAEEFDHLCLQTLDSPNVAERKLRVIRT